LVTYERADDFVKAGVDLGVLDHERSANAVRYVHQLLQEFFAARVLARGPRPELARSEWRSEAIEPGLAEALATLHDYEPLPPAPASGWEETFLLAAEMVSSAAAFVGTELDRLWCVSFITAAAPYAPCVGQPASGDLLRARTSRVLAIASAFGHNTLVLSAWGCGSATGAGAASRFRRDCARAARRGGESVGARLDAESAAVSMAREGGSSWLSGLSP
jgi:hypothetical protein